MDIHQLEAFYTIAKERHFRRAAEILYITQPAISSRITLLEEELQVSLFERSGRNIELTRYGESLMPFARKILSLSTEAAQHIHQLRNADNVVLHIGTTSRIVTYVLPKILERFQELFPGIRITVATHSTEDLIDLLSNDQIQLGLINTTVEQKGVSNIPLLNDSILLVVAPDHPLYMEYLPKNHITLDLLGKYSIINFNDTTTYYKPISQMLEHYNITPHSFISVDNIEATKKMTIRRLGVSFLPKMSVQQELMEGSLVEIPFPGQQQLSRETFIVFKQNTFLNPAIENFVSVAKALFVENQESCSN